MFVRRKKNKSGSISVQIISKRNGKYCVEETVGSSKDIDEIEKFVAEANSRINFPSYQRPLISVLTKEDLAVQNFIENTSNLQIKTIGPELVFGKLFDKIGFNIVKEDLFRHIVIARLAYPTSKLKRLFAIYSG